MSLAVVNEIWKLLRGSIDSGDIDSAAEMLVNYLVEEDYSPTEIKQAFRGDTDIKKVLDYYLETPEDGLVEIRQDDYDLDFDEDYDESY